MGKLTINHPFSSSLFLCLPGQTLGASGRPNRLASKEPGSRSNIEPRCRTRVAWWHRPSTPLVIKHSMDWFCWENVHRKAPMIFMEKSMVSGEDVPQQNQSIETWLETPAPKKWKLFHVKIIEVIEVNGGNTRATWGMLCISTRDPGSSQFCIICFPRRCEKIGKVWDALFVHVLQDLVFFHHLSMCCRQTRCSMVGVSNCNG